ncbi:MAG: hypothetical protein WC582_03990 [Patescibacteria group bacterium]
MKDEQRKRKSKYTGEKKLGSDNFRDINASRDGRPLYYARQLRRNLGQTGQHGADRSRSCVPMTMTHQSNIKGYAQAQPFLNIKKGEDE